MDGLYRFRCSQNFINSLSQKDKTGSCSKSPRKQPYIRKDGKYKRDLDFAIITESEEVRESTGQLFVDQGFWTNPFNYRISILHEDGGVQKEDILFSNFGVDTSGYKYREQNFSIDGEKENSFEFVANYSGVLKIQVWE